MNDDANPYVSPSPLVSHQQGTAALGYESALHRSKWATWLLATTAVAAPLIAFGMLKTVNLLVRMETGEKVAEDEANQADLMVAAVTIIFAIGFFGSVIAFCMWIYRTHRNLGPLAANGLRYTSGWAAGSFFVPILNLFRPYQITQEIVRGSDPETIGDDIYRSPRVRSSSLVKWWWGAWLIMGFADRIGNAIDRHAQRANNLEAMINSARFSVVAAALVVPAAILAILVIRKIQSNQDERYARMVEPE